MEQQQQEMLALVEDLEHLAQVKDYLLNPEFDYVAFDTETTGLDKSAEIVGYSISCEKSIGIYVILAYWDKTEQKLIRNQELKNASLEILNLLATKKLIMHNCNFDCEIIRREFNLDLTESVHTDTLELSHLLNENESAGLKEIASREFGVSATTEKELMKASVVANGGEWKEAGSKEMFKADKELLGKYGAKDTILTLKIFYLYINKLFDENLDKFFYDDESMPLLLGPTSQLNNTGLRVDMPVLKTLQRDLDEECTRLVAEIRDLVQPYTTGEDWPFIKSTKKKGIELIPFSPTSNGHIAWLLFIKLGQPFGTLTKSGKEIAKKFIGKLPYDHRAKREFIKVCQDNDIQAHKYMQVDADNLELYENKYEWVKKLLQLKSAGKILTTYVEGILEKQSYGIIYPNFLQHGTTSGRFSSRNPNFQNLPRDDKRVKKCIVSRPGRVFVGADYSQLEPRVFASVSQDKRLMECFAKGEDFYSVVGIPIFNKHDASTYKNDPNSFAKLYEALRNISKAFALATPYGTSAFQQSQKLKLPKQECQDIINSYFEKYPSVELMMLESHQMAKDKGVVYSLFGRPRRMPEAMSITKIYGNLEHGDLPYEARNLLNLAMNHRVQSSAASIVNRAMIAFYKAAKNQGLDAKIVLQIHDEVVIECKEEDADVVSNLLKFTMENTTTLPGVALVAEPKIAKNLADLK